MFIFDGCNGDAQVFPVPVDIRQGSCNNDGNLFPTAKYSVCPIIEQGHVPAGMPFQQACEALTVAETSLYADVTPPTYDATKPTTLALTTSFASDMTQRLSEGTCSDVLGWEVQGWTITWPDGQTQQLGGTGRQGLAVSHQIAATPQQQGARQAEVTVVAHLHVIGQALDFDANGNPYVRAVDGYVDISNRDGATGNGSAPVDEPPVLQVGAVPVGEDGDGHIAEPDPMSLPLPRAVTIRGRLLALYLSPIVVQPGVELIGGAQVGVASSRITGWRYLGPGTDAPPNEGTTANARGDAATPVVVQYDHAERLDAHGNPLDEQVPVAMTVQTTYPDGTVLDSTLSGDIAVAIYYAGLTGTG